MNSLSSWIRSLESSYPDPSNWNNQKSIPKQDAYRFARLWLCEGIPFAFKSNAAAYELAREKFAKSLDVHPRDVSVTGSGRIGYSLASHKFGRPYDSKSSDIDLFLVSNSAFEALAGDGKLFASRFEDGIAKPRNDHEKQYWPENVRIIKTNIERGFINNHMIPNTEMYKIARSCYAACATFQRTIQSQFSDWGESKITVRIYRDWNAAVSQIGGTLILNMKKQGFELI